MIGRAASWRALVRALALLPCACQATTLRESAPAPAPSRSANRAAQPRFSGSFADFDVVEQGLSLPLPDHAGWRSSRIGSWSVLTHELTESRLRLKLWRAPRLVSKEECAAMARLGQREVVTLTDDELIERRPFSAPSGFDTELTVGVRERGGELHGFAQVFGATIGRCYAASFESVTRGAGRERELGRRLTLMVETALAGVEVRAIEDRVGGGSGARAGARDAPARDR